MPRHAIDISEEDGVRYLHFGSEWVQGAMRIRRPWSLELDYTREMLFGLLLREPPWPKRALLIGLGAGSLAKFLWRHLPETRITVVEINPQVPRVAQQFFRLPPEDERLEIIIGDGAAFAESVAATRQRFDLILVDGFDHNARVGALDSQAFYAHCRGCLGRSGILATNLFRSRGLRASLARVDAAFAQRRLALPPLEAGNTIAIAASGSPIHVTCDELRERAIRLKRETGLDLAPTIRRLQLTQPMPDGLLSL